MLKILDEKKLHDNSKLYVEINGVRYYSELDILSACEEVDENEFVKDWVQLPQNWTEEEYGDSGKIEVFTGNAFDLLPPSQFLSERLEK